MTLPIDEGSATPRLLHGLFAAAAARCGDRYALEIPPPVASSAESPKGPSAGSLAGAGDGTLRWTFAQLDAEADRVRDLIAPLVHRECVVAILLPSSSPLLYAAQLGVLRAGAAFVCLDTGFPEDHMHFVLRDSEAVAVLSDPEHRGLLRGGPLADAQILDTASGGAPIEEAARQLPPRPPPSWLTENSLAYVVYTSGTTGRPKGVMIEHRSACHLIAEELEYLGLTRTDRCVQVSSPAYDSSIEESWLPLAAGATVIVADSEVVRLGPDLVPWLQAIRATVIMPTPTLLRMTSCEDPRAALPDLRIVYVGGEAVPPDLVDRWAPGRRFENGYGPTECTVTITRATLELGRPVTIGKAIPGNDAWVMDGQLEPVPAGHEGELCISGEQLSRGYLGKPELTAERFPTVPGIGRIYRTGDLVRADQDGNLVYLGRADTQVKVRGYRIELEAIEASMAALPSVNAAACRVARRPGSPDVLEAFFVPSDPAAPPDVDGLLEALRQSLPEYMVPASLTSLGELPTTTSGKLDRQALPDSLPPRKAGPEPTEHRSELEALIAGALASPLGLGTIGADDDYFEVGGDSLGVAMAISILRQAPETASLGVRDVYEHRTAAALARHLEGRPVKPPDAARPMRTGPREGAYPAAVTAAQTAWLLAELCAGSWAAYAAVFLVAPLTFKGLGVMGTLLAGPLLLAIAALLYAPLALGFAVLVKRALIGRYTAQRAPVWGGFYLRHWVVQRAVRSVPWGLVQGTVFHSAALRALGAKVGRRVHIHRGVDLLGGGWDLLSIGDDVTLSQDCAVGLVHLEDGEIVVGPVTLGAGSTLEVRAGVGEDTTVGEGAELSPLSYLERGDSVEPGARYDGVPARRIGDASGASPGRPSLGPAAHGLLLLAARGTLGLAFTLPAAAALAALIPPAESVPEGALAWLQAPFDSPCGAAILMALSGFAVAAWLAAAALLLRFSPSIPIGTLDRWGAAYVWLWLRTSLMTRAGTWLAGSLFWRWWLRLAGMELGRNCEVSTILDTLPEHVSIGDECFFADGIYLAGPRIRRGVVETGKAVFSEGVFLGNHVVIEPGRSLPAGVLLGVCTAVQAEDLQPGSSWFGHPPFELPRREVAVEDRRLTHDPGPGLYLHRLGWEVMRLAIPAVLTAAGLAWLELTASLGLLLAPLATLAVIASLAGLVCGAKWSLLGRVRPGTHGFWSTWCARWDFVYVAWGMLSRGFLSPLGGTLLLPWYLRAMGVRVGRRVVLGGEFAQVVDPDMLEFADDATIDRPLFQAHSFEDRVLKIDRVKVGAGASVRRASVLFYGSELRGGARVEPHSVVMKNETLSSGVSYGGVPTRVRGRAD